ncbi:Transcription intermediary factor 1-beta, partial [Frankliniella fusca]
MIDLNSQHGQRIPHILNCGHAACRPCLRSAMSDKKIKSIVCGVCETPSTLLENSDLFSVFPIHLYLVGQFLTRNAGKREDEPSFSFPAKKKAVSQSKKVICHECDVAGAKCFCRVCAFPFCDSCFDKIHQGKTLKTHVKEDVRLAHVRTVLMCQKHPKTDLDMLCETCNTPVCMKCSILSHKDHSVVSISEKNEEKLPEVKADLERANVQRARLKETLKVSAALSSTGGAGLLAEVILYT